MKRFQRWLCVVIVLLLTLVFSSHWGVAAEPQVEKGFQVGKTMPFHVVDFMGEGPRGGGCPSVMISNSRQVGIEIWSRKWDDSAFELSARLQGVLPAAKQPNCFLLLFDKPVPSQESVAQAIKKFDLQQTYVCSPRSATRKLIDRADPDGGVSTIVFVEHRKVVRAVWQFKPGTLNKDAIDQVVAATRKLIAEQP